VSESTSSNKDLHPAEVALYEAKTKREFLLISKEKILLDRLKVEDRDMAVRSSQVRHLWINDAIIGNNTDIWISALQVWERRNPGEPVTVDINSPGGSVTDGLALFDQIKRMQRKGTHVTTRGTGLVASMAAVLLQAGDERVMDARAKMLIHEGSTTFGGGSLSVGEQDDFRTFSLMLQSDILDILAERSTMTKRQISTKWRRKDWYLGAEEALKLGFVDRVE